MGRVNVFVVTRGGGDGCLGSGWEVGNISNSANVLNAAVEGWVGEEGDINGWNERRSFSTSGNIGGPEVTDGGNACKVGDEGSASQLEAVAEGGRRVF